LFSSSGFSDPSCVLEADHEFTFSHNFCALTVNYAVPGDCTVGDLLDDLAHCMPRSRCDGDSDGGGDSGGGGDGGGGGGKSAGLEFKDLHCLCVVLLDLATDPRASQACCLALPRGAALATLGVGSGAVLTLVPKASLFLEASLGGGGGGRG